MSYPVISCQARLSSTTFPLSPLTIIGWGSRESLLAFRNRLFLQLMPRDIPDNPDEANRTPLPFILCCGVRSEVRFAFSSRPTY
jgi:hypothetical protein